LEILDSINSEQFKDNLVKEILEIEKRISKQYGNRGVLSLTTKFLWLKTKRPILIYDSQARIAIGTKDGDLAGYYQKWREDFEKYQPKIKEACTQLSNLHLYAVDQDLGTKIYRASCKTLRI